jgi:hypothetical protein
MWGGLKERSSLGRSRCGSSGGLRRLIPIAIVLLLVSITACGEIEGESASSGSSIDSTPEKMDGSSSYEFEAEDIERAESASPEVQEYCAGASSEAQEVGCLSHVEANDIP